MEDSDGQETDDVDDPVHVHPSGGQAAFPQPLVVIAAAHDWARHSYEHALLLAPSGEGPFIIGVAVAAGLPRSKTPGVRPVEVGPWLLFREAASAAALAERLSRRDRTTLRRILEAGYSRPLPPGLSRSVSTVLRAMVPEFDRLTSSLPPQELPRRRVNTEQPARLDATATALRIFSRNWRQLSPQPDPQASRYAAHIELATRGDENDYISDDAAVFLDWDPAYSRQGWWEFREGERVLHVKNINVSGAESSTGADLVYVRRHPDTVVLVQYKLLETVGPERHPIFRPDGRLEGQIQRMLNLSSSTVTRGKKELNARLGPDFAFVKFIMPMHGPASPQDLPTGRYLPADAARRMLLNPDSGPKGGKVHFVFERRYVDGETFARLVRDRWVGSTGKVTEKLLAVLGVVPSEDRAPFLTIAVES